MPCLLRPPTISSDFKCIPVCRSEFRKVQLELHGRRHQLSGARAQPLADWNLFLAVVLSSGSTVLKLSGIRIRAFFPARETLSSLHAAGGKDPSSLCTFEGSTAR